LVLWLDDDQGVVQDPQARGTLLKWMDQSPNAFLASVMSEGHLAIDAAAVNGHDAFVCHNRVAIDDDPAFNFGTGPFAIALVIKPVMGVSTTFWQKDDVGYVNAQQFGAPDCFFQTGGGGGPKVAALTQDPNEFHAVISTGPQLQMIVDGLAVAGPTSMANLDSPGWPLWLCIDSGTGAEIAEAIAVKGSLSPADIASLEQYLWDKFDL
jgi:hypothetical protein